MPDVELGDLRLDTVPDRLREQGDPSADIDAHAGTLDALHDLARRDEEGGLGDAPWPPHFPKQKGEPKRVQPSRDRDRPKKPKPKPNQPGRVGDPQPPGRGGKLPEPQRRRSGPKPKAPRTGQGRPEEFDD